MAKKESLVRPEKTNDDERDMTLRPKYLSEFIGQQGMKENLSVFITTPNSAAKALIICF